MIIAVDFDGTLCNYKNPGIGEPKLKVIEKVKELANDNFLILWSCRRGKALKEAVKWCKQYGLFFNAINKNAPGIKSSRKIYADLYIDDKADNSFIEEFI